MPKAEREISKCTDENHNDRRKIENFSFMSNKPVPLTKLGTFYFKIAGTLLKKASEAFLQEAEVGRFSLHSLQM